MTEFPVFALNKDYISVLAHILHGRVKKYFLVRENFDDLPEVYATSANESTFKTLKVESP